MAVRTANQTFVSYKTELSYRFSILLEAKNSAQTYDKKKFLAFYTT